MKHKILYSRKELNNNFKKEGINDKSTQKF